MLFQDQKRLNNSARKTITKWKRPEHDSGRFCFIMYRLPGFSFRKTDASAATGPAIAIQRQDKENDPNDDCPQRDKHQAVIDRWIRVLL
jgi:hypothetical protein